MQRVCIFTSPSCSLCISNISSVQRTELSFGQTTWTRQAGSNAEAVFFVYDFCIVIFHNFSAEYTPMFPMPWSIKLEPTTCVPLGTFYHRMESKQVYVPWLLVYMLPSHPRTGFIAVSKHQTTGWDWSCQINAHNQIEKGEAVNSDAHRKMRGT